MLVETSDMSLHSSLTEPKRALKNLKSTKDDW